MTAVSSRIAAALPSNGRMRNTFMERSSSKGSLNGIRSARAHVAAPAERRGETVEQASGRPAARAYRRLHLHRAPSETAEGRDQRRTDEVWRICHSPRAVGEEWDGPAKLRLARESRKSRAFHNGTHPGACLTPGCPGI